MVTKLALILTMAASSAYGMHDALEDRLMAQDEAKIAAMAEKITSLSRSVILLERELGMRNASNARLSELIEFLMMRTSAVAVRSVETQTDNEKNN